MVMSFLLYSQEPYTLLTHDTSDLLNRDLFQKYLSATQNIDESILELIELSQKDHGNKNTVEALRKIQIALILENQLPYPDSVTFYLNGFAGDLIRTINPRYSLGFYKKATAIISLVKFLPHADIFNMYTNRAGVHRLLMERDSATWYFRKAMNEAILVSQPATSSSYNNLGVYYQGIEKFDSARVYFEKAKSTLADPKDQINLYCAIMDNLAQLDMHDGEYKNPLKTFLYNDSVYHTRQQAWRYFSNKIRLLGAMEHLGMPGMDKIMDSLTAFAVRYNVEIRTEEELKYYQFAYNWYSKHGERIKQDFYHDRYISLHKLQEKKYADELDLLTTTLLRVQETSFKNEMNAHLLNAEQRELKLKSARLVIIISILSGLFIISLLILYIRKRRQDFEIRQKITATELKNREMESRLVQQELELKKRDLTNIVLHNTQVYDSNHKMIVRLMDISQQKKDIEQHIRSLLVDLQGQNQISERSIGIQANIESVNAEFYEKLKQRFPDLTKAESELCGFIRINLSSKDISILKNVEATSVKMGKNRLRKKLSLDQEADIYDFMRKI